MASAYAQSHDDLPLLRFALSLSGAGSPAQLERRFRAGFGRFVPATMFGFNIVDPLTRTLVQHVPVNVSDAFVERYVSDVMGTDPLRAHAFSTRRPAYNRALMQEAEWEESEAYRAAYSVHRMRHVVEAPLFASDGSPIGGLHMASSDPAVGFAGYEIEVVELLGRVIGSAVDNMQGRESLESERDLASLAMELSNVAVVSSSPSAPLPRLNAAAARLLSEVVDAEEMLPRLLARPGWAGGFSRRLEVSLRNGDRGTLSAHSTLAGDDQRLVTVLDLRSQGSGLCAAPLGVLTRREAEVAVLVSEGLGDREIAACLQLSHHTVSQYVKRVYRKLDVDSRVALTRLLLGAPIAGR